jgi:hypothetical protein
MWFLISEVELFIGVTRFYGTVIHLIRIRIQHFRVNTDL